MPSIISFETSDGGLHTVASVNAADVSAVIERSAAFSPVELLVRDLSTADGLAEAIDDAAIADAVKLMQAGQRIGRNISLEALAKWRDNAKPKYKAPIEHARDLGQVVVTLTAPTQEAAEAILL